MKKAKGMGNSFSLLHQKNKVNCVIFLTNRIVGRSLLLIFFVPDMRSIEYVNQ